MVVIGSVFLLYALTRSENLALAHDSLAYLGDIEAGGTRLFHPHHLLYNAAAAVWLKLGRLLGLASDAAAAIALLNSVFGALAAGTLYALLRKRAQLRRGLALSTTIGAAVSFGFWFYSGCVEVYLLPLLFLLATLYVALATTLTRRHLLTIGFLHGVAMLGHQIHVLFGLVILAALWLRREQTAIPFGRSTALYVASGAVVVLLGYGTVLLAFVRPSSFDEAWSWFTLYAYNESYWHGLSVSTFAKAAMGLSRAFVGGHFAFALPSVRNAMAAAFPDKSLVDEAFLVRGLPEYAPYLLIAGAALFGLGFGAMLIRGVLRRRQMATEAQPLALLAALWIGIYSAFFLFWQPYNVEFWIPQVTALWILLALLWTDALPPTASTSRASTMLGLLAALLFTVNLFGVILPATDAANDVYAYRYGLLAEYVGRGDLVVVDHPHLGLGYTQRLTDAEPISIAGPFEEHQTADQYALVVVRRLSRALDDGHRVLIESSLVEYPVESATGTIIAALRAAFGSPWHRVSLAPDVAYFAIDPDMD